MAPTAIKSKMIVIMIINHPGPSSKMEQSASKTYSYRSTTAIPSSAFWQLAFFNYEQACTVAFAIPESSSYIVNETQRIFKSKSNSHSSVVSQGIYS